MTRPDWTFVSLSKTGSYLEKDDRRAVHLPEDDASRNYSLNLHPRVRGTPEREVAADASGTLNHNCDEGELVGMVISRRPKRRASSENAPGPRQAIATAITVTSAVASLVSNKFGFGGGNHARAVPRLVRATRTALNGVR